jgi:hypothetical protein
MTQDYETELDEKLIADNESNEGYSLMLEEGSAKFL